MLFMELTQEKYYTVEDFYKIPEEIHAELINGELVYMGSPSRIHQKLLVELITLINHYIKSKKGDCEVYPAPFDVQLWDNKDTIVEPDISVICDKKKLNKRGCIGAPDWIIEIVSPSNPEHDYIDKLHFYTKASVREYWIVDPQNQNIHVYNLEPNQFHVKVYTFQDTIKVGIYEDLFIDFAMIDLEQ